mgnify:FL=1
MWPLYLYLVSLQDQPPGGQIFFLIIPRILGTCKTVIKSFLKSIVVFLIFFRVCQKMTGALAQKLRAVMPRFSRIMSMRL